MPQSRSSSVSELTQRYWRGYRPLYLTVFSALGQKQIAKERMGRSSSKTTTNFHAAQIRRNLDSTHTACSHIRIQGCQSGGHQNVTSTEFSDVVTPSPICPQLFNPFPLSGDVIFECPLVSTLTQKESGYSLMW